MRVDRRATKDQHEREEDEAARLVKPAPKVKPPRHDLKRERVHDHDPDVDGDPDLKGKDRSLNYKDVGAAMLGRLVGRFLLARDEKDLVPVVNRETGESTRVTENTLRENPQKYEKREVEESKSKDDEPTEESDTDDEDEDTSNAGPANHESNGNALHQLASEDERFDALIKSYQKGKNTLLSDFAKHNATFEISRLYPHLTFPPGVKTVQDFVDAMKAVPKATKGAPGKPSAAPAKPEAPKAPEKAAPAEAPKEPEKPAEAPKAAPAKSDAPEVVPAPKSAPDAPKEEPKAEPKKPKPPESKVPKGLQQTVERLIAEAEKPGQDFRIYAEGLPTGKTDADGKLLFPNPAAGAGAERFTTFNKLPPEAQVAFAKKFDEWSKIEEQAKALSGSKLSDEARATLEKLSDESSTFSRKLQEEAREHGGDLTIDRAIPALKGMLPEGIETVADLQRILKQKPALFRKKTDLDKFVESGGADSPEFKEFAKANADKTEGSTPLFKDPKSKKPATFAELSPEGKQAVYDKFTAEKQVNALRDAQKDDDVLAAMQDLANPNSDLAQGLSEHRDKTVASVLPSLKHLPDADTMTVEDLTKAAKKLHPPIPEPKRRPFTEEEQERTLADMLMSVPADERDDSLRRAVAAMASLHPDDAKQAFKDYVQMRKMSFDSPAGLNTFLSRVQGKIETDPTKIRPPRRGNGKDFNKLSDEERAEVMARHRNLELAVGLAVRDVVGKHFTDRGAPEDLAEALSAEVVRKKGGDPASHAEEGAVKGRRLFEQMIARGVPFKDDDHTVRDVLDSIDDPVARKMAVGYYQAGDYLRAVDDFFGVGYSERSTPKRLAAGLEAASKRLKSRTNFYGEDKLFDVSRMFRERIVDRLNSLDPEKAEALRKELGSFERAEKRESRKEYERAARDYEKRKRKWEKDNKGQPYREEAAPEPPPGYNPDEHKSGEKLLEEHFDRLGFPKSANRVASRWVSVFSSYPLRWAMAASTPTSRTALYHGVDPYAYGADSYPEWSQAHQRDLGESDYTSLLKAAREWLRQPVLAKDVEGIEKDAQHRAALDLAIKDHEGGRYDSALHPAVYNLLLAKLAGESEKVPVYDEPGLKKTAGLSYAIDRASFLFTPGKRSSTPFNIDTIRAINGTFVNFVDDEGNMHAVDEDGGAAVRVINHQAARQPLTFAQEKSGMRQEARVDVEFPEGSAADVKAAMISLGKKLGFTVEPISHSYQPGLRKVATTGDTVIMTMPKFAAKDANAILGRLDKLASDIQDNYESWGMPFEAARDLVNNIDKTADEIEAATFGTESLATRQEETVVAAVRAKQAQVIQHDADEKYMATFGNPSAPKQVESDEPYMKAYGDDQSSGVRGGKSTTGKPLT